MKRLEGKKALVTGASSGIGEAIARAFAAEGADCGVGYAHNKEAADKICADLHEKYGVKAISIKVDLGNPDDITNMVDVMMKEFGRIDILVNNGGASHPDTLDSCTLENWEKVLAVDLTGPFLAVKAVAPVMKKQHYGRIINISSSSVLKGQVGNIAYISAKGGLNTFSRAVSKELVPYGINLNILSPGPTNTRMFKAVPKEIYDQCCADLPLGQLAEPEETARTAVFLASSDGDIYVGKNFAADCGENI